MLLQQRPSRVESSLPDLSEAAVQKYQQAVRDQHPSAQWYFGHNFGRIVAGNLLLSLRFSLIDPQAEEMAWRDAAQRLGGHSIR